MTSTEYRVPLPFATLGPSVVFVASVFPLGRSARPPGKFTFGSTLRNRGRRQLGVSSSFQTGVKAWNSCSWSHRLPTCKH